MMLRRRGTVPVKRFQQRLIKVLMTLSFCLKLQHLSTSHGFQQQMIAFFDTLFNIPRSALYCDVALNIALL